MADFTTWKNSVLGIGLDIDHAFGDQCVDVVLSWSQACFPSISWGTFFTVGGNAKDLYSGANLTYFDQIANDHHNPDQLPQQGDIAVFAPSPQQGYTSTFANPDGHCGVVDSADTGGLWLVQQDGSNPQGVTFEKYRPWLYTECIGWLRPKTGQAPAPTPVGTCGKNLFLPSSVDRWRVYDLSVMPRVGNEKAFLRPSLFPPGLTYQILGNPYPNVYTIQTQNFGVVNIYAGADTDAQIN